MNRPVLAAVAGLAVLGMTAASAYIIASPAGEEEVVQQVATASPAATTASESFPCPPPRESMPCSTPAPVEEGGSQPSPPPVVINSVRIPLPEGAELGIVIRDPGGRGFVFSYRESWLTFDTNGWIVSDGMKPADAAVFNPTLDLLYNAASPAIVNGVVVRVPRGVAYHPPVLNNDLTDGWLGPPERAPDLHVFERGSSVLSYDAHGKRVATNVAAQDEQDFAPLIEQLASAESR